MDIVRASRCYFSKWITEEKLKKLRELIREYSRVCNYLVEKYDSVIPDVSKYNIAVSDNVSTWKKETGTFFTSRLLRDAFFDVYSTVLAAKKYALSTNKTYNKPVFKGTHMSLSANTCQHFSPHLKKFDYLLKLFNLRNDKGRGYKLYIPLKRHSQFNKWYNIGTLSDSIIITEKYVLFSFKINTNSKKTQGNLIGFDFGLTHLGTLSDGTTIGSDIINILTNIKRKKRYSNAYYRSKEALRAYINSELKKIDFNNTQLIVFENLKGIKYKSKERGRLSKNIRSIFCNLSCWYVFRRLTQLCEENCVSFRRVSPYRTSIECSRCGHTEKTNRLSQSSFVCRNCGYSDNADYNASKVILKRFVMGKYGSHYQQKYLEMVNT